MKSQGSLKFSQRYCICVNFLVLSNGQPWYKRLTLEEAGWRVHSNSLCNFSVSWKLLLVAESCPSLPNSMDCSLPGSSVHGILQARILEWVSISFSRGPSWPRDQTHVFCTGRWILYLWITWEVPEYGYLQPKDFTYILALSLPLWSSPFRAAKRLFPKL